jgi:hypothetical protein
MLADRPVGQILPELRLDAPADRLLRLRRRRLEPFVARRLQRRTGGPTEPSTIAGGALLQVACRRIEVDAGEQRD